MSCSECGFSKHPFCPSGDSLLECPVCAADCRRNEVNWALRQELLFEDLRSQVSSSGYHCVVPIRGDAEDYFVLNFLIKNGLTPLVLFCNSYFLNELGWRNTHNLITRFDVDSVTFNPNFQQYREFVSHALRRESDPMLPIRLLRHAYAQNLAKEKGIGFVVYGMCQPEYYAGNFLPDSPLRLSKWWIEQYEMSGRSLEQVLSSGALVDERDLFQFSFPSRETRQGVQSLFLSNYMHWRQNLQNTSALDFGYLPQKQHVTVDWLENAGSAFYYTIHDELRFIKYGDTKGVDHIRLLLREGEISMDEYFGLKQSVLTEHREIDSFFKNFLQATKSGIDWFKKERLEKARGQYGARIECSIGEFVIAKAVPKRVSELAVDADAHPVMFMKGI
jgi:hypothetical protein